MEVANGRRDKTTAAFLAVRELVRLLALRHIIRAINPATKMAGPKM